MSDPADGPNRSSATSCPGPVSGPGACIDRSISREIPSRVIETIHLSWQNNSLPGSCKQEIRSAENARRSPQFFAMPRLRSWYGRLWPSPFFAALAKGNGRIDDHQVALFDALVYFHLRSQIARHRHLVDMRRTILDHGHLHSVLIEN